MTGIRVKSFDEVVAEVAQQKNFPTQITVSTNEEYQLLMVPIFNQQMGEWYK